jgi:hypothetical protein
VVKQIGWQIDRAARTEFGLREVERAKADGRWDRAHKSGKEMKIPTDLQAAIDAEPKAKAMLAKLSAQNRFALAFRLHREKSPSLCQRAVYRMVLGSGVQLAAMGTGLGLAGALWVGQTLSSISPEITARDLPLFAVITIVLIITALFACWLPARRAARVDPVTALRGE